MENLGIPVLNCSSYYHGKSQGLYELKHSLVCATLELETTQLAAQDEIYRREEEIRQLKDLLSRTIEERDEVNDKYQRLLIHHHQQQQQVPVLSQEDDGRSEESIVCESPVQLIETMGPLPEKGKLLQAVMKAGPLLQTLLLAGPLPQWRHPPPPLEAVEIPPVAISVESQIDRSVSANGRKRNLNEDYSTLTLPPPSLRRQSEGVFHMPHPASLIT